MATAFRVVISIVLGFALALVLLIAVEGFSAVVHPTPPDFKGTMDEMCHHVEKYPQWVLAVVVFLWGGTAFASTWVTGRIGNRGSGTFMALLLLAGVLFNAVKLPYPMWFKIVMPLVVAGTVYLGVRSCRPRQQTAAATS